MTKRFTSVQDMVGHLIEDAKAAEGATAFINARQLSRILVICRNHAGLSQSEMAERIGWAQSTVSKLEHQPDSKYSIGDLEEYANALGLKVEISFLPKSMTIVDRVKHYFFRMKESLDQISGIAKGDDKIQSGVNAFMTEASWNLLRTSLDCLKMRVAEPKRGILVSEPPDLKENASQLTHA